MFTRARTVYRHVAPLVLNKENAGTLIKAGLILTGLSILLNFLTPYIFGIATSMLYTLKSMPFLWWEIVPFAMVGIGCLAAALSSIVPILRTWILSAITPNANNELYIQYVDSQISQSLMHFQSTSTGYHNNLLNKCYVAMPYLTTDMFTVIIPTLIEMIFAIGIMWKISGYAIALSGVRTTGTENAKAETRSNAINAVVSLGQAIITNIGFAAIIMLVAYNILFNGADPSDYVTIGYYLQGFTSPLTAFGSSVSQLLVSLTDMHALVEEIEKKSKIEDKYPNVKLNVKLSTATIEFKNVSYSNEEKGKQILKNVSFKIEAGKTTALVGISGSGKSTITDLIFRFKDPTSGKIYINGHDTREVSINSLRSAIGVVPQTPSLFSDTIYNNIAYGGLNRPSGVSREDVMAAVKIAGLTEYINSLPEGLNTKVGEHGTQVSGGERQRIAIARAYLKIKSIAIYDEVTASLDGEMKQHIQAHIDSASQLGPDAKQIVNDPLTQIVISHDLTKLKAQHIIVLAEGGVAEEGTHDQLIAKNGVYPALYRKQSQTTVSIAGDQKTEIEYLRVSHSGPPLSDDSRLLTNATRHLLFTAPPGGVHIDIQSKSLPSQNTVRIDVAPAPTTSPATTLTRVLT